MSQAMQISGLGLVGPFGAGREALTRARQEPPPTPGRLTLAGAPPAEALIHRADTSPLDAFIPKRSIRRADTYARLALLGACLALEDAGLPHQELGESTALVLCSALGATTSTTALLDSIIADGDALSSPTHFAHSLHNSAAAYLGILLGLKGPSFTISQGLCSVASGLLTARSLLNSGQASRVLFGAVEEGSEIPARYALDRAAQAGSSAPVLGEGAVFLLLESDRNPSAPALEAIHLDEVPHSGSSPWQATWVQRFGFSAALPAFQLACALLGEGGPDLDWSTPEEGPAFCRMRTALSIEKP